MKCENDLVKTWFIICTVGGICDVVVHATVNCHKGIGLSYISCTTMYELVGMLLVQTSGTCLLVLGYVSTSSYPMP